MIELPEGFDSIFRYINVVSQRSEQLINGAKPRSSARFAKPTLMAKQDVDQGHVEWRILTQEELDAQRQAIVDQFRAEMGAEEQAEQKAAEAQDVLPTAKEVAAAELEKPAAEPAKSEEHDEELERLQRLLGLGGGDDDAGLDGADEFEIPSADSDEKASGSTEGAEDGE